MEPAIVFIVFFLTIFGVFYLYITTRNRERMAMIEKGVDPALFSSVRLPKTVRGSSSSGFKFTLKAGMLFISIGIGMVVSIFFNDTVDHEIYPLLVFGIIFVFGGTGLIAGYYMGRNLEKKDAKD